MNDLKIGQTVWVLEFNYSTVSKIYYEDISNIEFIRNNPNMKLIETKISYIGAKLMQVEVSKSAKFNLNDLELDYKSGQPSRFKKVYLEEISIMNITLGQLPKTFLNNDKTAIRIGRSYR